MRTFIAMDENSLLWMAFLISMSYFVWYVMTMGTSNVALSSIAIMLETVGQCV